jgi:hypothetical protein
VTLKGDLHDVSNNVHSIHVCGVHKLSNSAE